MMGEIEISDGEVPTALYRLYSASGSLLYVGITVNVAARMSQHAADKPWWPEVERKTATWYTTRREALSEEVTAIREERPRHNVRSAIAGLPAPDADEWTVPAGDAMDMSVGELLGTACRLLNASRAEVCSWFGLMSTRDVPTLGEALRGHYGDDGKAYVDDLRRLTASIRQSDKIVGADFARRGHRESA